MSGVRVPPPASQKALENSPYIPQWASPRSDKRYRMGTEIDTRFGSRECSSPRSAAASAPAPRPTRPRTSASLAGCPSRNTTPPERPPRQPHARQAASGQPDRRRADRPEVLGGPAEGWTGPPYGPFELADSLDIELVARQDLDDARLHSLRGRPRIEFNPVRRPPAVFDRKTAVRGRSTPIGALGGVGVSPVPDSLSARLPGRERRCAWRDPSRQRGVFRLRRRRHPARRSSTQGPWADPRDPWGRALSCEGLGNRVRTRERPGHRRARRGAVGGPWAVRASAR